jgi:uncharacterized protein (TIGR02996 family)
VEHPEDDVPRLVYADWLEERGDPARLARAEFIRLQCAWERSRRDGPGTRMNQLLVKYEREWLGELRPFLKGWGFRRGFVESARIGVNRFLAHADTLFRREPVRRLSIKGGCKVMPAVASSPHLARLVELNLSNNRIDDAGARALAASPHLARLTNLHLNWNWIGDEGARALAASPFLKSLTDLGLWCNPIGSAGREALRARFGGARA